MEFEWTGFESRAVGLVSISSNFPVMRFDEVEIVT